VALLIYPLSGGVQRILEQPNSFPHNKKESLHHNIYKYVDPQINMVFTEIKTRNNKKYYYRVLSIRNKEKISKKKIYLGVNLSQEKLKEKEIQADKKLFEEKRKRKGNEFQILKQKIIKILKQNKIKKAGIFGSYARGEQTKNSDIDILIQPTKDMSLLDISGLRIELTTNLSKKVDIVSYNYIHPRLKQRILREEIKII